jgi:hypothetical protein
MKSDKPSLAGDKSSRCRDGRSSTRDKSSSAWDDQSSWADDSSCLPDDQSSWRDRLSCPQDDQSLRRTSHPGHRTGSSGWRKVGNGKTSNAEHPIRWKDENGGRKSDVKTESIRLREATARQGKQNEIGIIQMTNKFNKLAGRAVLCPPRTWKIVRLAQV